jgi:hypothetical protein
MTTEKFIIALFCLADDQMGGVPKHPQARLWPSEMVTIGLLYALKGGYFRAFYRWLVRDRYFGQLPERSRLLWLLRDYQVWCDDFLADVTFFTLIDTYGIELIHPIREGRSHQPAGRKGKSNYRWIVGIKLCWLVNDNGQVVDCDWHTANVADLHFRPVAEQFDGETITLTDPGFRQKDAPPGNLKHCPPKTWNERMLLETILSLITRVCHLKHLYHRVAEYLTMHLSYLSALFNLLLSLNRWLEPEAPMSERLLHIAEYAL